jgi:hypothetical protein
VTITNSFNSTINNFTRAVSDSSASGKRMIQPSLSFTGTQPKKLKLSVESEEIEEIQDDANVEVNEVPITQRLAAHFDLPTRRVTANITNDNNTSAERKLFANESQWAKSVIVLDEVKQKRICRWKTKSGVCNSEFGTTTSTTNLCNHLKNHLKIDALKISDFVVQSEKAKEQEAQREDEVQHQQTMDAYAVKKDVDKQTVKVRVS